jgi:predicted P-loop ATPase
MQTRGVWIIELAELDSMSRAEVSRVKAFVSRSTDRFRPPYGRRLIESPRQCIFAGTINNDEYLKDETGGRRFWPVACGNILIKELQRDRNQLWAEATRRYHDGAHWWLETAELIDTATEQQQDRFARDPWHEKVLEYAEEEAQIPPSEPRMSAAIPEILGRLGLTRERQDQGAANRVARILRFEGWSRHNEGPRGARQWRYRKPKEDNHDA